jgi:hypothetical protein
LRSKLSLGMGDNEWLQPLLLSAPKLKSQQSLVPANLVSLTLELHPTKPFKLENVLPRVQALVSGQSRVSPAAWGSRYIAPAVDEPPVHRT